MLKNVGLKYDSKAPQEVSSSEAKVIITTKNEARMIDGQNVIVFSDVSAYPILFKAKILKNMAGTNQDDILIIGVDPGNRIGICILYLHAELQRMVQSSSADTIKLISILLRGIPAKEKIVRIGDGHQAIAYNIAYEIRKRFKNEVTIELVDEFGTSRNTASNRRGNKDEASARNIASRKGLLFR
ncbi:MAG TPA: hypothetical protein VF884_05985 [Nitrososphaeraceae archaeon]